MARTCFAITAALFAVCLLAMAPSLAQQTTPTIVPNPLVEQLMRAAPQGEKLVELRGYVGTSTPDTVRLYADLSLSRYFDIPRSAIVHLVQEGDPKTGPVKIYLHGSTAIVSGIRHSASAIAPSSQ